MTQSTDQRQPEEIYYRVLQIGSECLACGITFKQLKQKLEQENYETSCCTEESLKKWFDKSFEHETYCSRQDKGEKAYLCVDDLDKHSDCTFVLTAESCMRLLTFKESENNKRAAADNLQAAKDSLTISQRGLAISNVSKTLGYIAFGLGLIGLLPIFFVIKDQIKETKTEERLQQLINKTDTLDKRLLLIASQKDSTKFLHQDVLNKSNPSSPKNQNDKVVSLQDNVKDSILTSKNSSRHK